MIFLVYIGIFFIGGWVLWEIDQAFFPSRSSKERGSFFEDRPIGEEKQWGEIPGKRAS